MKSNTQLLGILFFTFFFNTFAFGQAPTFTSTPITAIDAGNIYDYTVTTTDPNGDNVTVTAPTLPDWLSLVTDYSVTTLAGSGNSGNANANGASASFNEPRGVAVDASGNVYVADELNHIIRKIAPNGTVTTLAGSGSAGNTEGNGTSASFNRPHGVAVDAVGNVYVADFDNSKIRKIAANGDVTTLAGSGTQGSTDANGASASFNRPSGVAVDADGNVYVADQRNDKIRKIATNGEVTTLAGSGTKGSTDANGASASFSGPSGIAVDASGNVYVGEWGNHKIRKIAPNGDVTTLAGSGSAGSTDANGANASFNRSYGIAVDASNNVYIADQDNHKIRKIAPNGDVTTLAGSGTPGSAEGNGTSASFNFPSGIAVDDLGNVYVGDVKNHKIRKISGNSLELTGDATANVGSHEVILEANDGNGGTAQQSFTIVVSLAVPTLTFEDINNTYGDADFTLGATSNSSGTISYAIVGEAGETVLSGTNNEAVTLGNAGTVTIRATLATDGTYLAATKDNTLTIAVKAITVTADAGQTKVFDAADPTFTYTLTTGALATGDSFTGVLSRAEGEEIGAYTITVGTLSAGANYDMTFVGDDFSITEVLAIDDNLSVNDMIVFSNGNRLKVRIDYQLMDATVSIYSLNGSLMKQVEKVDFVGADWSTPFHDTGLFIIAVESKNHRLITKFVK